MPIKRLIPFIVAGVFGLATVFMLQAVLQSERKKIAADRQKLMEQYRLIEPIDVIVARKDIAEGEAITAEHLDKKSIPKQFVQPYATSRGADLLGMVAKSPIATGEQILTNKLRRDSDKPVGATLSAVTPEGMRAVTIGTDALGGVGGFVRPGDKVDVLWTLQVPKPDSKEPELVTVSLFQAVDVLAVGPEMVGKAPSEQVVSSDFTVTISLTPQQASLLLYAREQGKIQLALRPTGDKDLHVAMSPTDMEAIMRAVMGDESVPPARKPERMVEVIKGMDRSMVSVTE